MPQIELLNTAEVLDLLEKRLDIVLLLVAEKDDSFRKLGISIISANSFRYDAQGFKVVVLEVCEESQLSRVLSCVKVPQVRVYKGGSLVNKIVGLIEVREQCNGEYFLRS